MELIGIAVMAAGIILGVVNFNTGKAVHIHLFGFDTTQVWWWRFALAASVIGLFLFLRHAAKNRGWRS